MLISLNYLFYLVFFAFMLKTNFTEIDESNIHLISIVNLCELFQYSTYLLISLNYLFYLVFFVFMLENIFNKIS